MLQVVIPNEATWTELFLALKARHVPVMLSVAVDTELLRTSMPTGKIIGKVGARNGGRTARKNGGGFGTFGAAGGATDKILDAVRAHPGWTATQIRGLFPDMRGPIVASTLARLADSGTIKATGKRGKRHYRVAENLATA